MRLLASVLLLLTSTTAFAQEGLDLPYPAPVFREDLRTGPPPELDDEGDDPRDTPPPTYFGEDLDHGSDSIIYVLDLSCSMKLQDPNEFIGVGGVSSRGTRSQRAIAETVRSIAALAESFRFSIVVYGKSHHAWAQPCVDATALNKTLAIAYLMSRVNQCLGDTDTSGAVKLAFKADTDNKLIALLTDGAPNWDGASVRSWQWHRQEIRNKNPGDVRIDVFGYLVGEEARSFCRGVASDSSGQYFEVR